MEKFDRKDQTRAIMSYYRKNSIKWSCRRRRFTEKKANAFFVGVMLDLKQGTERAWEAGQYMVENYFYDIGDFWQEISVTHFSTIKKICREGYDGQPFALGVKINTFPKNLKSAAKKIVGEYESDVRNVWNNVDAEHVDEIYSRFEEFEGIGDALAKMAQFILVRDYGIAGGKKSKKYLSVKPDTHLQRVLFRLGLAEKKDCCIGSCECRQSEAGITGRF